MVSTLGSHGNLAEKGEEAGLEQLINRRPDQPVRGVAMATTVEALLGALYIDSRSIAVVKRAMVGLGLIQGDFDKRCEKEPQGVEAKNVPSTVPAGIPASIAEEEPDVEKEKILEIESSLPSTPFKTVIDMSAPRSPSIRSTSSQYPREIPVRTSSLCFHSRHSSDVFSVKSHRTSHSFSHPTIITAPEEEKEEGEGEPFEPTIDALLESIPYMQAEQHRTLEHSKPAFEDLRKASRDAGAEETPVSHGTEQSSPAKKATKSKGRRLRNWFSRTFKRSSKNKKAARGEKEAGCFF